MNVDSSIPINNNFYSNDDWRFDRPRWDTAKCIRCGVCALSCPDSAIFQNQEGYYEVNLLECKGCGLCVQQCITGCISLEASCIRPPWLAKNF